MLEVIARSPRKVSRIALPSPGRPSRSSGALLWAVEKGAGAGKGVREKFRESASDSGTLLPFRAVFSDPARNWRRARSADFMGLSWSERRDLNPGPPVPQTGALTGLRYAPMPGHFDCLGKFAPKRKAREHS